MLFEKLAERGSEFLGVKYPLIAGAMTWISDVPLVAAVSRNGAFPVLAGGNMPPDMFEQEVDTCMDTLDKPFAVNLITIAPNYPDHYEILLSKKVPVVVFAGGIPRKSEIEKMKSSGIKTMSFAADKSIAEQQIRFGIDALILEGNEAGGHIGHVSLMILLQQVLFDFDQVPIFVGGGLASGRMVAHLLMMGAAGCQFGTLFVMTEECSAHPEFKKAFIRARARQAMATPQYDSKLPIVAVRAVKNRGSEDFGRLQIRLLQELDKGTITRKKAQFEVEKYWIGALHRAVVEGDVDYGSLMAGQSVGMMQEVRPMKTIIENLVSDAEAELVKISSRLSTLLDD